ncbi:hypothetical protein DE146DRAFT_642247 [Phaeosphaeria sp. MPI-PUGE-AT-0046c]|nr:hypothetical protein DE146DRAFT_642247 [Phaeosphaeria sp. MPI-PUGE-AT-0046c]
MEAAAYPTTAAIDALPTLDDTPVIYSGCCLALSTPLVRHIHSLLAPRPALVLSVGSGFGLLEAHLLALAAPPASPGPSPHPVDVVGVEVEPSPNKYLPASCHRTVHGTRFLEPLAAKATTWLFVYPRRINLVREYMDAYGQSRVRHIIWIGPQADWDEYEPCFAQWHVRMQTADEVGGRPWDTIVMATRPGVILHDPVSDANSEPNCAWESA